MERVGSELQGDQDESGQIQAGLAYDFEFLGFLGKLLKQLGREAAHNPALKRRD